MPTQPSSRLSGASLGSAVLLGLVGVAILSGADKWLMARVTARLPDAWLRLIGGL